MCNNKILESIEADCKGKLIIPKVEPHKTLVHGLPVIQTFPPSFKNKNYKDDLFVTTTWENT